ncbi:uncharacterized protein K444DRAFT_637202 [Hyaloscypha bicolor E]|uniref:Apple domain-containing protein n=1 Tax=Hyaloscypha bicolor E TaxID=1095630 RepID=A0A2J6SMI5_9HELO|nr:uncharacterized protein K444DRAFT_637202 [Hyaloscypha bicolor E]PMD51973.1 hypothetical protein K444DRAFT_637202 [Hyaloscypha bicolor E]
MKFLALILLAAGLIQALPGLHKARTSKGPKKAPQPTYLSRRSILLKRESLLQPVHRRDDRLDHCSKAVCLTTKTSTTTASAFPKVKRSPLPPTFAPGNAGIHPPELLSSACSCLVSPVIKVRQIATSTTITTRNWTRHFTRLTTKTIQSTAPTTKTAVTPSLPSNSTDPGSQSSSGNSDTPSRSVPTTSVATSATLPAIQSPSVSDFPPATSVTTSSTLTAQSSNVFDSSSTALPTSQSPIISDSSPATPIAAASTLPNTQSPTPSDFPPASAAATSTQPVTQPSSLLTVSQTTSSTAVSTHQIAQSPGLSGSSPMTSGAAASTTAGVIAAPSSTIEPSSPPSPAAYCTAAAGELIGPISQRPFNPECGFSYAPSPVDPSTIYTVASYLDCLVICDADPFCAAFSYFFTLATVNCYASNINEDFIFPPELDPNVDSGENDLVTLFINQIWVNKVQIFNLDSKEAQSARTCAGSVRGKHINIQKSSVSISDTL